MAHRFYYTCEFSNIRFTSLIYLETFLRNLHLKGSKTRELESHKLRREEDERERERAARERREALKRCQLAFEYIYREKLLLRFLPVFGFAISSALFPELCICETLRGKSF